MAQANSAEEHKLFSSFETIKNTLLQDEYRDRLDKPLAYWALPNDRRLPLAFLGRPLGELLQTPFAELSATRGIGQKKISSLVKLLHRATSSNPPAVPYGIEGLSEVRNGQPKQATSPADGFDPTLVSEALWVEWCNTVQEFHLGRERLGRLAPSLQSLPTVIWRAPLGNYLGKTLTQIRQLKTHGEKRVRVVLEVFHAVHEMLSGATPGSRLSLNLVPRFVPVAEEVLSRWQAHQPVLVSREEVAQLLGEPLLRQIQIDSGATVHALSRDRLGVGVPAKTVRDQSREMGVTRARVYQLLEDCSKVMEVRWPEGRHLMDQVGPFQDPEAQRLFDTIAQLFFPDKQKREKETAEPRRESGTGDLLR